MEQLGKATITEKDDNRSRHWINQSPLLHYMVEGTEAAGRPLKTLDFAYSIVIPSAGEQARYGFSAHEGSLAKKVAALWPQTEIESNLDRHGNVHSYTVSLASTGGQALPSTLQPTAPQKVRFVDGPSYMGLLTARSSAKGVTPAAGRPNRIGLVWQAEQHMEQDLTTFVHLVDVDGRRVGQYDRLPGNGSYSTMSWTLGETVVDWFDLEGIDPCASNESVEIQMAFAPMAFAPITIEPSSRQYESPPVQQHVELTLGAQVQLIGLQEQPNLSAGDPLTVTLVWRAQQILEKDYVAFLHLLDADGTIVAQSDAVPAQGYTTTSWLPGEFIIDKHVLAVPQDLQLGTYRLVGGLYNPLTGERLPVQDQAGHLLPGGTAPLTEMVRDQS